MPAPAPERLRSLDAMRGFVIASMLLVNMTWNAAAAPNWLFHVPWNDPAQGATFADLVFPWFVFVAGCAAPLSIRSGRGRDKSNGQLLRTAAVRAVKLYLLGVLLTVASFAHERPVGWHDLLSWNILQLLGVAYFVVIAIQLAPPRWRLAFVPFVLMLKWLTLLIPYETVSSFVTPRPAEGAPLGGGTWAHFDAMKQLLHVEFVAPATWWSSLLGWVGMAQQYLPLAAVGVVGALATERLTADRSARSVRLLAGAGVGLVAFGWLLQAGYQPTGGGLFGVATVPFSKWLFSPAYCLLAAGTGLLLLTAFHVVVDRSGGRCSLGALQTLGKNALAIYVGAELSFKLIFSRWLLPLPTASGSPNRVDSIAAATQAWIEAASGSPTLACMGWAFLWLAAWWLLAWRLDAHRLYWKV